jgi:ABC-type sugar transport system ATPase subunit
MEACILNMKDISKSFGGVAALRNVSIDLNHGEVLAIVGENGAGKSTLMKILSGSYHHASYQGTIEVNGTTQRFATPHDAERVGIEMIYQEISMHLDMSIAENIFLGRIPSKVGIVNWKKLNQKAKEYADMVGLDIPVSQTLRTLSTSQQQMVAIARALSRNPRILVLDEPTSALTEREVDLLFERLNKLKTSGMSFIYITHKMKEVMYLADRITVLRDGNFVHTRGKAETSISETIEAMVNRKIESYYPKRVVPIGEEVLRVENLSVVHPQSSKKMIVDDISFSVKAGEILGLVGLVGAGRSETVNAIYGSIKKKSGRIFLKGKEIVIRNPRQSIELGIALLSEDRKRDGFVGCMSIAENCTLASLEKVSTGLLLNKKKEQIAALEYIKLLTIKAKSEKANIGDLSGGNQQKVVLAKWLLTDPDVLILDEPTRGIDVGAKAQIYEIMGDLAAQGKAIIVISSELPELVGMCDRFVVLGQSKIQAEFLRGEVDEEELLRFAV